MTYVKRWGGSCDVLALAETTGEVLTYRGIGSVLVRLTSILSVWWSKMRNEGIKPGNVTSEGLEMIFPVSTGVPEGDDYPVQNRQATRESLD